MVDGSTSADEVKVNIDESRYDQSTYWGRAKHFSITTNPLNLFASSSALELSKEIVTKYRKVCTQLLDLYNVPIRKVQQGGRNQILDSTYYIPTLVPRIVVPMLLLIFGKFCTPIRLIQVY